MIARQHTVITALAKAMFVLAMPIVLFVTAGWAMMHLTGRDQFRSRAAEAVPLNFRARGYDAADAAAYWNWLGPDGRGAERRFLEADLAFPFLYGGALLASLLLAWAWLGRPFHVGWLVLPVAITVVADWAENLLHWQQLKNHAAGLAVSEPAMAVASMATSTKLAAFWISSALVVALAGWLVVHRA